MKKDVANSVLQRHKRANWWLEELKTGSLERECNEEICSYEEAREIFKVNKRTDTQKCIYLNGGCEYFCNDTVSHLQCSCADGYELAEDKQTCVSKVFLSQESASQVFRRHKRASSFFEELKPGNLERECKEERCSYEEAREVFEKEESTALLVNEDGMGFCGGTILNNRIVLTAAHCMNQTKYFTVVLGEFDTRKEESQEMTHRVEKVLIHNRYVQKTNNNNIALVKLKEPIKFSQYIIPACLPNREFAEQVLMNQPFAQISGFGRVHERGRQSSKLQKLNVPYVDRHVCIESSQFKITANMFCAGYENEEMDACQGDSGGPHVTNHKGTWFVTGIVSWGEGCAKKGKYGIYTQVSRKKCASTLIQADIIEKAFSGASYDCYSNRM
ncbi:UNVERIFIED_CONTAM: hypothetical protein FKN15_054591 [Acipenser sinensis]